MRNAYAADWSSEFVVQHLEKNDNQWPSGWDDLRDEFESMADSDHYPWTWEELKARIIIQWDANPEVLAKADGKRDPPFEVIELSNEPVSYFVGGEPNRKVFDYLQTTDLIK